MLTTQDLYEVLDGKTIDVKCDCCGKVFETMAGGKRNLLISCKDHGQFIFCPDCEDLRHCPVCNSKLDENFLMY